MKIFLKALALIYLSLISLINVIAQKKPELVIQTGHSAGIRALAINHDSTLLASAGVDKTIIIWDIRQEKQLYSLKDHSEWVFSLAFSPDGKHLASGSSDGTVKIWDVFKGTKEEDISLQPYDVTSVAYSPSGNVLAISSTDKIIKLWDVATRKMKTKLDGHSNSVTQIAFSPGGEYLASSSLDTTLIVWDLATGKPKFQKTYKEKDSLLFRFGGFHNPVGLVIALRDSSNLLSKKLYAQFSPETQNLIKEYDGKIPVSDSLQNALVNEFNKLLQGESLFEENLFQLNSFGVKTDQINQLKFLSVKKRQGEDLIRFNRLLLETAYPLEIGDSKREKEVKSLAYSRDGKSIICATADNIISLWDLKTQELTMYAPPQGYHTTDRNGGYDLRRFLLIFPYRSNIYHSGAIAFGANNEVAFVDSFRVRLWDIETKREILLHEIEDGDDSYVVTFNKEGDLIAFSEGKDITVTNINTKESKKLRGGYGSIDSIRFSKDGKWLFSAFGVSESESWGDSFAITEKEMLSVVTDVVGIKAAFVSSENLVARIYEDEQGVASDIKLFNPGNEDLVPYNLPKEHKNSIISLAAHPTKPYLASCANDKTVIWDIKKRIPITIFEEPAVRVAFSPNGELLVTVGNNNIKIWKVETWENIASIPNKMMVRIFSFSPDSKIIAVGEYSFAHSSSLNLWDAVTGKPLGSFRLNSTPEDFKDTTGEQHSTVAYGDAKTYKTASGPIAFSRDSQLIATAELNLATLAHRINIWKVKTGELVLTLPGHLASIRSIAFASDKVLASASWDNTIKLWRIDKKDELMTLVKFDPDSWVAYTPNGRFDTNIDLEESDALHWNIPGSALASLPLDIFMRDYFEPKMFQRWINCSEIDNCESEFREIRDLSELNTVRPEVRIANVSLPNTSGDVNVTIEVSQGSDTLKGKNGEKITRSTGVYDLRLFRDRRLVGVMPSDSAEKLEQQNAASGNSELDLKVWREASKIKLNAQTGKQTVTFKVRLPLGKDASNIKFTAYAFNEDRIKSKTARYDWTPEQLEKLPKAQLEIKRRAYVVSVGVDKSRISDWDLNHGADDAYKFQKVVSEKLKKVGIYEIVPIELVSNLKNGYLTDNATKQNIKTVCDLLAGKNVSPELRQKIPNFQQIAKVSPDDFVLITFSTHGFFDNSKNDSDFYLFPSDISLSKTDQRIFDLRSMISSEELSIWLRDIDVGEMGVVIDACQSAAAVERSEFKPGPMGNRGLGQLAYDKRIKIITATQATDGALEVDEKINDETINQGLLSYALVQDGLVKGKADLDIKKDGKITLREWFGYAEIRVPELYKLVIDKNIRGVKWKRLGKMLTRDEPFSSIQRASLFDFSIQDDEIIIGYVESLSERP